MFASIRNYVVGVCALSGLFALFGGFVWLRGAVTLEQHLVGIVILTVAAILLYIAHKLRPGAVVEMDNLLKSTFGGKK